METQVRLVSFNPHHDGMFLNQLVECYRIVFGEHPWSEWKKCSICGQKWGIEEANVLHSIGHKHCGKNLDDYWPAEVVREDLFKEITPEASCWLAIEEANECETVIGFCLEYPIRLDHLEAKLGLPGISKLLENKFGAKAVGYLDEVGLVRRMRGKHIAKKLYCAAIQDVLSQGIEVNVMRTKTNPPAVSLYWFLKYDYKTVAEYHDSDGRVVLAKKISELDKF